MTKEKDGVSGLEEALAWAEQAGWASHADSIMARRLAAGVRRYQARAPAIEAVVESVRKYFKFSGGPAGMGEALAALDAADAAWTAYAALSESEK